MTCAFVSLWMQILLQPVSRPLPQGRARIGQLGRDHRRMNAACELTGASRRAGRWYELFAQRSLHSVLTCCLCTARGTHTGVGSRIPLQALRDLIRWLTKTVVLYKLRVQDAIVGSTRSCRSVRENKSFALVAGPGSHCRIRRILLFY